MVLKGVLGKPLYPLHGFFQGVVLSGSPMTRFLRTIASTEIITPWTKSAEVEINCTYYQPTNTILALGIKGIEVVKLKLEVREVEKVNLPIPHRISITICRHFRERVLFCGYFWTI